MDCLEKQNIRFIRPIQKTVIPKLLENVENICFTEQTGSGKTLAYLIPTLQNILLDEAQGNLVS